MGTRTSRVVATAATPSARLGSGWGAIGAEGQAPGPPDRHAAAGHADACAPPRAPNGINRVSARARGPARCGHARERRDVHRPGGQTARSTRRSRHRQGDRSTATAGREVDRARDLRLRHGDTLMARRSSHPQVDQGARTTAIPARSWRSCRARFWRVPKGWAPVERLGHAHDIARRVSRSRSCRSDACGRAAACVYTAAAGAQQTTPSSSLPLFVSSDSETSWAESTTAR